MLSHIPILTNNLNLKLPVWGDNDDVDYYNNKDSIFNYLEI